MRVGILGGTFDPVHIGHLRATEEVRTFFKLDKIIMVPVNIPPHKRDVKISPAKDRLEMLRMAAQGNDSLEVSDIEISRGGVSYTIETVLEFERLYGDVYYIVGIDSFHEIDTWHNYEDLFYHANFIVMTRPSKRKFMGLDSFPEKLRNQFLRIDENTYSHVSKKMVHILSVTQLDISSSKIRENVKNGISIKYLVPSAVEDYIYQRGLYRE